MYPVSGGTARFPHYAFGGAAGASFGWFSWLQAATVAPIEVLGDDHLRPALLLRRSGWLEPERPGVLTTTGLIVAVVLMALLTVDQLPRRSRSSPHTNSAATWWKVARAAAGDPRAGHRATSTPATSPPPTASAPTALHGILAAVSTSGIIFSYLGFEQADQLAGEAQNPKRDIPLAIIGSIDHRHRSSTSRSRSPSSLALPDGAIGKTWARTATASTRLFTGPFARARDAARHRLAGGDHLRRRDHLARPAPA